MKILIADDETRIRRKIIKSIEVNNEKYEIIGEAEDGDGAIEISKVQQPDLVIIDSSLPCYNSNNTIREIKSILDNPIIIIIASNDQFNYEYIKDKLNVFDYILRPLEEKVILEKIDRAYYEFRRRNGEYGEVQENKEEFLKKWVRGKIPSAKLNEEMIRLNIEYTNKMGILVLRVSEGNKKQKDNLQIKNYKLVANIDNIAEKIKKEFKHGYIFEDNKNQIVIICNTVPIITWYKLEQDLETYILNMCGIDVIAASSFLRKEPNQTNIVYKSICNRLSDTVRKSSIIIDIQRYIKKYYYKKDLSISEIAKAVGVTQTYFVRMFKRELGTTFIEYLTDVRIKNSIVLMRSDEMELSKVANYVGYESLQYFSNIFEKKVGISPEEYKNGIMAMES